VCPGGQLASGGKAVEISEGFKFYYNSGRLKQNGVGIAVGERFRDDVTEINRDSDRLMSIKINREATTIRMVACYAPQQGCTDEAKEKF